MMKFRASAQKVQADVLGRVVSRLYRYALDISFKRSGGLFLLIRNQNKLKKIVRMGDGLQDPTRAEIHKQFENFLVTSSILGIDRNVAIELSSIDGAVVISNHGKLLAYGAVLVTTRKKSVNKEQGSRSKAAVSASDFGIAIKISSDGGISFYEQGKKFIEI
jgi:ATP-dependent DNA ligase